MAERFRQFIFASDDPRMSMIKGDYREHTEFMRHLTSPRGSVEDMINNWAATADEPYLGITADGKVIPGLYELEPDGAPVQEMVDAADSLTRILTAQERTRLSLRGRSDHGTGSAAQPGQADPIEEWFAFN